MLTEYSAAATVKFWVLHVCTQDSTVNLVLSGWALATIRPCALSLRIELTPVSFGKSNVLLHEASDVGPRLLESCDRENGSRPSTAPSTASTHRSGGTVGAGVVVHRKPIRTAAAKAGQIRDFAEGGYCNRTYSSWLFPAHSILQSVVGVWAPDAMLVPQSSPSYNREAKSVDSTYSIHPRIQPL
jgi:hypothetical protein